MFEEKTINEVKHAKILSLNAACDPIPADIKGADLLIFRFDGRSEDQLMFAGQMAGMVNSSKIRFVVAVYLTTDAPEPLIFQCFDTVICVSSEIEAEQAVKTLSDACTKKSLTCLDLMDIMWVIHCGKTGYFAYSEKDYQAGILPEMAKEFIRKSSIKCKIAIAKRLLVCINRGSGGEEPGFEELNSAMDSFYGAISEGANIIFPILSDRTDGKVSIGVIATGF